MKLHLDIKGISEAVGQNRPDRLFTPVSDDEYGSFVDDFFRFYESLILDGSDELLDIGLTDYTFAIFVAQHLHVNCIKNKAT